MQVITKKKLLEFVARNEISEVFYWLKSIKKGHLSHRLLDEIVSLESRHSRIGAYSRIDKVEWETKSGELNQITSALIELIHLLPDHLPVNTNKNFTVHGHLNKWKWVYCVLFTGLLVGRLSFVYYFQKPSPDIASNTTPPEIHKDTLKNDLPAPNVVLSSKVISKKTHSADKLVMGRQSWNLAYIDYAYQKGREHESTLLESACWYNFSIQNPSQEHLIIESIFVELLKCEKIPSKATTQLVQPFYESNVVYVLMGDSTGLYRDLFHIVNDKRKNWGNIQMLPSSEEFFSVRINAKKAGIYTFKIGIEYRIKNKSDVFIHYVSSLEQVWAFLEK